MNKIIFIATGWGRTAGGINAFNYSLCKTMGRMYGENIVCIVPDADNKICTDAKEKYGIHLVGMVSGDFKVAEEIVKRLCRDGIIKREDREQKIIWIGHDIYTGYIALACRDMLKGSRCAVIHHMAYHEYYPILNDDSNKSMNKEKSQREVLGKSDYIFPNGPKLKNSAKNLVGVEGGDKILEILPGLEKQEIFFNDAQILSVVTFGRVEEECGSKKSNSIIKQINLAVAAWASFVKDMGKDMDDVISTNMDVIGYDRECDIEEANREIKSFAEEYGGKSLTVRALQYMDDPDDLFEIVKTKSLYLMLSKEEGFGLCCLEAISLGIPVILSKATGLYQALKERKLENYVLSVQIDGTNVPPYFTERDLENVKIKIKQFFSDKEKYKEDILALKERLGNTGFSWEQSVCSMVEFMQIDMKKPPEKICREVQMVSCREKFSDERWFDRWDLYEKIDLKYSNERILLIEGPRQSNKEVSVFWWAKSRGIDAGQLYYFDAQQDRGPECFRTQAEKLLNSGITSDTKVYIFIVDFPATEPKEYFEAIRQMLKKYIKLYLIIFTNPKFINLSQIRKYYNFAKITIRGLSKESVKDYFGLYGIDISEDEIERLAPTEYLPEILRDYVEYVLDQETDVTEAIQKVEIDRSIPEEIFDGLSEQEKMMAGILALFDTPFSKNVAERMARKRDVSRKTIDRLVNKGIIFVNSKFSYKVPAFYRKYLREIVPNKDKMKAYLEISKYYYHSYQYAWDGDLTDEDIMRGINACKFAIKAQDYESARNYLDEGKVKKRGKKKGLYKLLIPVMKELYKIFGQNDKWLVYDLVHCLMITGDINFADNILHRLDLDTVTDRDCRVALLRLKGEVYCEYHGPEETYEYLSKEYSACGKPVGVHRVADEQMQAYLFKLQMDCGLYGKVLVECEKYMQEHKSNYLNAILLNYVSICKRKMNVEQGMEEMEEAMQLFGKLDDERGIAWTKMEKGMAQFEKNIPEAEDTLAEAITAQKKLDDCSMQYRIHLSELCKGKVSETIGLLLEEERDRVRGKMKNRFIPEELRTYQYS